MYFQYTFIQYNWIISLNKRVYFEGCWPVLSYCGNMDGMFEIFDLNLH